MRPDAVVGGRLVTSATGICAAALGPVADGGGPGDGAQFPAASPRAEA